MLSNKCDVNILTSDTKKIKITENFIPFYRASYILNREDAVMPASFLANISFNEQNKDFRPGVRYRALQVLQTITDTKSLEKLTQRDIISIR